MKLPHGYYSCNRYSPSDNSLLIKFSWFYIVGEKKQTYKDSYLTWCEQIVSWINSSAKMRTVLVLHVCALGVCLLGLLSWDMLLACELLLKGLLWHCVLTDKECSSQRSSRNMADLQTHQVDEEDRPLACAQAPEEIPASHPPVRKTKCIHTQSSLLYSQTFLEN